MTEASILKGTLVAFSMSPPADIGRLGLPGREFDRLVYEMASRIVRGGGRLLYGGHLTADSVTLKVFEYLHDAYARGVRRDYGSGSKPFLSLIPVHELAAMPFPRLLDILKRFSSFLELRTCITRDRIATLRAVGQKIRIDGSEPVAVFAMDQRGLIDCLGSGLAGDPLGSLTTMRLAQGELVNARICFGGKRGDLGVPTERDRFHGTMPGLYEETMGALKGGVPTIVLGAYGGAARDIAIDLDLMDEKAGTPYLGEVQEGYVAARRMMRELRYSLLPDHREVLSRFANRDDTEILARDVTHSIGEQSRSRTSVGIG